MNCFARSAMSESKFVRSAALLLLLTAVAACAGPGAAASAPAQKQAVWCPNPLVPMSETEDCSGKDDPNCFIRLEGARNGVFSGQAVFAAPGEIPGLKATAGELKPNAGGAPIPGSQIRIRYALPRDKGQVFDTLSDEPRAAGRVHPVWVSVKVPADAAAGAYEGALSVGGRAVPVRLTVADWTLPDPNDFTTFVDFIQSAESVAMQYKVPLWSDRHLELVGNCFRLLAELGNDTIYLHLAGLSNFGNEQTTIRWIKENETTYRPVFDVAEKYLDAALSNGIKPRVIVLYIWEPKQGGSCGKTPEETQRGVQITVLDPATGRVSTDEGPSHNNKSPKFQNYPDDQIRFWKPVLDGLKERFDRRGLKDTMIVFGIFKDGSIPGQNTVDYLKKIAPYALWCDHAHGLVRKIRGEVVGYDTTVWNAAMPEDPAKARHHGWNRADNTYVALFDRDIGVAKWPAQIVRSRLLGELNIAGKQCGFGRMAADFWPVLEGKKGAKSSIVARFPDSSWGQLNLRATPYLAPGPDRILATIRYEMLREGLQECEARILIDGALLDDQKRARLGEELAKRCQDHLDDRVRAIIAAFDKGLRMPRQIPIETVTKYVASDWQSESAKLYSLAAEVGSRLGAP